MHATDMIVKHEIDAIYIIVFYLQIYFCYYGTTKFFTFSIHTKYYFITKIT